MKPIRRLPRLGLPALVILLAAPAAIAQTPTTWPAEFPSTAGAVALYQPQFDAYSGNQLTAHAAVSVTPRGVTRPTFGAVDFTANVATDRGTGIVTVENIAVTSARFPNAAAGATDAATQALVQAGSQGGLTISNEQLLAQLALTQKETAAASELNNTPPQILFETMPSVLITIAGEPKLTAAPDSPLLTVVNSPFFIALDPATKTYYLRGPGQWLSASDILAGPWTPTASVPGAVTALAAAQPAPEAAPGATATPAPAAPKIIVATQPTELIQTTGPAEYGPIENTNLLFVTNTESSVLMDIDTQSLYALLSGRWFTASSPAGPWTFVPSAQLPADFARIPAGLPISSVLASVPGTQTARNAVLDAQVPQTAAVQRSAAGPKITYDGAPKFQPVTGAVTVSYAVNTTHAVVQVADTFYACSDGVWFQAGEALGPWIVSTVIPPVIYTIPPSCPIYPVTYCRVYSVTPEVVYCGYLPGYTGSFVLGGTVVYGTGWPYDPWFGRVFIPRPVTWGFAASFHPGWGAWGFAVGGGWSTAAFGCSWHSGWWGTGNYRWNNWNGNANWNRTTNVNVNRNVTNNVTINHPVNNLYRDHPDRLTAPDRRRLDANQAVARGRDRAQVNQARTEAHRSVTTVDHQPGETQVTHAESSRARNDVYASRGGDVYRHDGAQWRQRQGDDWRPPNRERFAADRGDLNRHFAARAGGGFRGNDRRP